MTIVAESNKATTPNFIPTKSVPLKAKSSKGNVHRVYPRDCARLRSHDGRLGI